MWGDAVDGGMDVAAVAVEVDCVGEQLDGRSSGGTDNFVALCEEETLP